MTRSRIPEQSRAAWWLFVIALGLVVAFAVYSYIGTAVLGLFIYYAVRPPFRRINDVVDGRGLAAGITMLTVALPALAVVAWIGLQAVQEIGPALTNYRELLQPYVDVAALTDDPWRAAVDQLRNPGSETFNQAVTAALGLLQAAATGLTHVFIAIAIAFYLLRDQHRIANWFENDVGGEGTASYGYANAVDHDLQTIYFGNVLLVALVAVLALITYNAYNLLAPSALSIPFPTALALATGLASMVPLVVGKVVYVPLVGYLAWAATVTPDASIAYPIGLFVVAFLFLDLIPMTFLLPKVAGRETHVGLVMFGYIVGTLLFGWYGIFLGPLVVVLVLQAVRIVLSELLHSDDVTADVRAAESIGSDPDQAE
ncbi:AI-2E family transporter [Halobacterium zhouii]|uniref:AI-2E family transporter n=1 Tax=Halobacterium zhouii TaxID=2902624 RepID=UPI001E5C76E9|nr:AI-2E family transporter [Halobacterium zhouii]